MTDPTTRIELLIPTVVAHKLSESFEGTLADAALTALKLYHGLGAPARAALQALADQHSATPAKALRMAVEHFHKDSARLRSVQPAAGRPITNQDRDAQIYERTKAGVTHATTAAEFGISLVRVGQIVARQRALRNEAVRSKKAPADRLNLGLEMDRGMSVAEAATKYNTPAWQIEDLYAAYRANLPAQATMLDRINAARMAEQQLKAPSQPAQPEAAHEEKPLSLNVSEAPTKPRVLAVIPPSMRNQPAEERTQPIPVNELNMDIFQEDFPLDEVFGLRDVAPGRVAYTNTPK